MSITKDAKPPLPNSMPVMQNVRNEPMSDNGITDTMTHASLNDSN